MHFLLLKIASSVGMGLVLKQADSRGLNRLAIIRVNYAAGAAIAFFAAVALGQTMVTLSTALLAAVLGVLFVAGLVFWVKAIETGGLAMSVVAMRTAIVVPVLASIIYWREAPGLLEIVGAVWRGWSDPPSEKTDIWRRERRIEPVRWEGEENRSMSPDENSTYPQNSNEWVCMWCEGGPEPDDTDILVYQNGQLEDFWAEATLSHHPQMDALMPAPGSPQVIVAAGTWTEGTETEPPYEVMWRREEFELQDAAGDFPYLDCAVGDSVKSRYCRARDGHARWREFRVDYGHERLQYRLPYLNPYMVYRVWAVLYHASGNAWEESFALDGVPAGRFRYGPQRAETLLVTIPRDLYRRDFGVTLDIARLTGDYASVAELKVYEYYPFREKGGEGGGQASTTQTPERPCPLRTDGPALFRDEVRISYTVTSAGSATVSVFDCQGGLVKELASSRHGRGTRSVTWAGCDAQGRKVASGTYFIELRTESSSFTSRVVHVR